MTSSSAYDNSASRFNSVRWLRAVRRTSLLQAELLVDVDKQVADDQSVPRALILSTVKREVLDTARDGNVLLKLVERWVRATTTSQ